MRLSKGWKKELFRRAEKDLGDQWEKLTTCFMMDETVMGKHGIFNRHTKYMKEGGITFQVVGKFFEWNNQRFFLNEGIVKVFKGKMKFLRSRHIREFIEEVYKEYDNINPGNFYADGRSKTKTIARDTGMVQIKSKYVTARIDAVFGAKKTIYPKVRNGEISNPKELFNEYIMMFEKLGFKVLNPEYPL